MVLRRVNVQHREGRLRRLAAVAFCISWLHGSASLHAQNADTRPTSFATAMPENATGEQIFRESCATCHAIDGSGAPQSVVGFALPLPNGHGFPDFTDCPTNTVEPLGDWIAVASRGGPVRALDRRMPAFGDIEVRNLTGHKYPTGYPAPTHLAPRHGARRPARHRVRIGRTPERRRDCR